MFLCKTGGAQDAAVAAPARAPVRIGVVAAVRQAVIEAEFEPFLDDLGLAESGLHKMIRASYALLNLITFFTAGEKEVRAWTVIGGALAPQAAGVIHSDFENGFIRAEVIKYVDYADLGSELAVKEAGKIAVEGKEYLVQDGDVIHFRFNV